MRLDKCGFPQRPHFFGGELIFPFLHLGDELLGLEDIFGGNGHEGHIGYG